MNSTYRVSIILASGLATLVIAPPSHAQPVSCATATSQSDLNRCAGIDFKTADTKINRAYAQAMARLNATSKARLRDAQRAWVVFRGKQCSFESSGTDGGSVAPMVAANCATKLTDVRTKALSKFGVCVEGDVSCAR